MVDHIMFNVEYQMYVKMLDLLLDIDEIRAECVS